MPNLTREPKDSGKAPGGLEDQVHAANVGKSADDVAVETGTETKAQRERRMAAEQAERDRAPNHPERRDLKIYSGFFTAVKGALQQGGDPTTVVSHVRNAVALAEERIRNEQQADALESPPNLVNQS